MTPKSISQWLTVLFWLPFCLQVFAQPAESAIPVSRDDAKVLSKEVTAVKTDGPATVGSGSGTVAFWIKPTTATPPSRTLFSAKWQNGPGYMVISDGWWEHGADSGFYFVIDNSQQAFCYVKDMFLPPNFWSQITLTWGEMDRKTYCRVYLNGKFQLEKPIVSLTDRKPVKISFFSDENTDDRKNRTMAGKTSGWLFLDKPVDARGVQTLFDESKAVHGPIAPNRVEFYAAKNRTPQIPSKESRVLFDEDILWAKSRRNTDELIAELRAGGFNVYIPCVWHGAGLVYPNEQGLYHKDIRPRLMSGDDPLAYLISEAHKYGIAIHPWFTVVRNDGAPGLQKFAAQEIEDAFDVHNAAFRDFIVDLMIDMAKRYPVDGINLDYIRSVGICTTQACQEDFAKSYSGNLILAAAAAKVKRHMPGQFDSSDVSRWNNDAVTSIVEQVSKRAKQINPAIQISVDSHPLHPDFLLQGHDSIQWLKKGLIDTIYSMDYRPDIDVKELELAKSKVGAPNKIIPLFATYDKIGASIVPRSPETIADYVQLSRTRWPNSGFAFYHRKQVTTEQRQRLHELTTPASNDQEATTP